MIEHSTDDPFGKFAAGIFLALQQVESVMSQHRGNWELGINMESLEDICNSAYMAPSDETHVKAAVALLTYYEDREDSGRVDPLDGPTIFNWLTKRGVSGEITSILTHPRRSA